MANVDRAGLLDLLGRLGAESDETALTAARELHREVKESGLTWNELLCFEAGAAAGQQDRPLDTASDTPAETKIEQSAGGKAEVARLIERLLARQSISETLREELTDLKRAIADGTFEDMDAHYVRALAKRLGV